MTQSWDEPVETEFDSQKEILNKSEPLTLADKVIAMANEIMEELDLVHSGRIKYDIDRAKKTAALALKVQIHMAEFLAEEECVAKRARNNVKFAEAEASFEARAAAPAGKKLTDAAAKETVARDVSVLKAENDAIDAEKTYKKWSLIFGSMRDAHVYFRNLGQGKNDWSM
jgi:hypothetical protein